MAVTDVTVPTTEKYAKVYDNSRRQIYVIDENRNIYQLWLDTFAWDVCCYVKWQRVTLGDDLWDIIWDFWVVVYNWADYIATSGEWQVQVWNQKINLFPSDEEEDEDDEDENDGD